MNLDLRLRLYYRLYHFFGRLEGIFFNRWIAEYQRINKTFPK